MSPFITTSNEEVFAAIQAAKTALHNLQRCVHSSYLRVDTPEGLYEDLSQCRQALAEIQRKAGGAFAERATPAES